MDDIARALKELDREPRPAARRFDDGAPLAGELFVLPSAFNPPTLAHQHLLERAAGPHPPTPSPDSFQSRARGGSPVALLTTRNVDKGIHGANLAHRIGMLLALRSEWPSLAVVASNQARIIDQAESLTRSFAAASLTFVVGFDTLERLFAPRYYTDMERELAPFFERHSVLAANRGDMSADQVSAWIAQHAGPFRERVSALEIDEFPASLSSTQVREALSESDDHPALAEPVRRYIVVHGLYR